MSQEPNPPPSRSRNRGKRRPTHPNKIQVLFDVLGGQLQANAEGWGVVAVILIVIAFLAALLIINR